MNDLSQLYELIERYQMGNMTPEEAQAFQERLEKEPALKAEYQLHHDLSLAIQDEDTPRMEATLNEVAAEYFASRSGKLRQLWQKRMYQGMAAVILLLVMVGVSWYFRGQNLGDEALFSQYYQRYEAPTLLRSGDPSPDALSAWEQAMVAYEAGNFAAALAQFTTVPDTADRYSAAQFFAGMCYLEQEQAMASIAAFRHSLEKPDPLLGTQARWYLALAYLKTGQRDKALPLLESIQQEPGKFGTQAKALLKALS